jgi:predicted DNA-binding WGR domain protein
MRRNKVPTLEEMRKRLRDGEFGPQRTSPPTDALADALDEVIDEASQAPGCMEDTLDMEKIKAMANKVTPKACGWDQALAHPPYFPVGTRLFKCIIGNHNKWWAVAQDGRSVQTWWARIGSKSTCQSMVNYVDVAAAQNHIRKLIRSKLKKGYTEE